MLWIRKKLLLRWINKEEADVQYIINTGFPATPLLVFVFRLWGIFLLFPRSRMAVVEFNEYLMEVEYERKKASKNNKEISEKNIDRKIKARLSKSQKKQFT